MTITMVEGDLFELGLPAIGHGCNCKGFMGAGIAAEFRRRYPDMYESYRQRCIAGQFELGNVLVWLPQGGPVLYNLATQPEPGTTAKPTAIFNSVSTVLQDAHDRGLEQVGIPRIGAGLGGLQWEQVEKALQLADSRQRGNVELMIVSLPSTP